MSNKAIVIYRMPNETHFTSLVSEKDFQSISNEKEPNFVFSDFDTEEVFSLSKPVITKDKWPDFTATLLDNPIELSKKDYLEKVNLLIQKINSGTYKKVVFSRIKLIDKPTDFNIESTFKKLCSLYPKTFVYCVSSQKMGTWMGATPELLLNEKGNNYSTVALAGTRTSEFSWTKKEIKEQKVVTDYILDCVKPFSNEISHSEPYDLKAGSVIHLKSDITFKIKGSEDTWNAIKSLHPTPAVCGIPKNKAKQLINEIEPHKRQLYTGFIGPTGIDNQFSLFVNLRNMQITKDKLALYVGGGIMGDSIAENEWEETNNKAQTMSDVL